MKVQQQGPDVTRSGVTNESVFNIKTSAKAFDILSSGLYTDPILAIVRELSCNAYDAHVDAGRSDTPFEIHLPNHLEPWFAVKDYGIGLSDEQIRSIFTTYFESTKTDSNDVIGALGLGSKSPLAYVNSFNVTSRYNGQRRNYTVFINEEGVPSITQMGHAFETDEHNGLEISLSVSQKDARKFQDATSRALKWFPVKPTVKGVVDFQFDTPPSQAMLEGENWKFVSSTRIRQHKILAVQGNVEYKVDIHQLMDSVPDLLHKLCDFGCLIVFFDIGDLEVAASREEIRYDERSKSNLIERINQFCEHFVRKLNNDIEQQLSDLNPSESWEGFQRINNYLHEKIGNARAITYTVARYLDNGIPRERLTPMFAQFVETNGCIKMGSTNYDLKYHSVWLYRPTTGVHDRLRREYVGPSVRPYDINYVFYNDKPKGGTSRVAAFLKDQHKYYTNTNVLMIIPETVDSSTSAQTSAQDYQDEYQTIVRTLGCPKVHTVSKDTTAAQKIPKSQKVKFFDGENRRSNRFHPTFQWVEHELDDLDTSQKGLYVPLRAGSCPNTGTFGSESDLNIEPQLYRHLMVSYLNLIDEITGQQHSLTDLVHANKAVSKQLERQGWTNVFTYLDTLINQYKDAVTFYLKLSYQDYDHKTWLGVGEGLLRDLSSDQHVSRSARNRSMKIQTLLGKIEQLSDESAFKKQLFDILSWYVYNRDQIKKAERLVTIANKIKETNNPIDRLGVAKNQALFDEQLLRQTYPMLQVLNNIGTTLLNMDDVDIEELFKYIDNTDKLAKQEQ